MSSDTLQRLAKNKVLVGLVFIACGLLLLSTGSVPVPSATSFAHLNQPSLAAVDPRTAVCNPYKKRGRLIVSKELSENRWVPVREDVDCPVVDFMDKIRRAVDKEDDTRDSEIDFLRGRSILLVGDSVDRGHILHICEQLSGEMEMIAPNNTLSPPLPEGQEVPPAGYASWVDGSSDAWPVLALSRPHSCYIPKVDLLIVNVFDYGLRPEDSYISQHFHFYPPGELSARVESIGAPLVANLATKLGRSAVPDLVSITQGFWGLQRTARDDDAGLKEAKAYGGDEEAWNKFRPLNDEFANWYESRTEEVLRRLGAMWPDAPERPRILWRALTRTLKYNDIPSTRRAAIDQISREVVDQLVLEAQAARAGSTSWAEWARKHPKKEGDRWNGLSSELGTGEKRRSALEMDLDRRLYVNNWGDLIDGMEYRSEFFLDSIHPGHELGYLYGNMLLEELREEVLLREMEKRPQS